MIFRKKAPPALYLATPSPERSPRCSTIFSDCDTDDEGVMSAEDLIPPRPFGVSPPRGTPLEIPHPQGPYCPRRPNLQEVLSNSAPPPWTLSAFTAYLSQNHCLETLEFTLDAERYRRRFDKVADTAVDMIMTPDTEDFRHLRMLWQRLLDAYIVPDGPREVNLPSDVRDHLLSLPFHTTPPNPKVLEPAVKIVYELMDGSVLVPFLNEVSSSRGSQATHDPWNDSDENESMRGSSGEWTAEQRSHSSRRRPSPPPSSLEAREASTSGGPTSGTSNVGARRGRQQSGSSNASGDILLTDDSGSASSPGKDPLTPPGTPPSSEIGVGGGSPRNRGDATWKKMTGRLGWKKKSTTSMRDSRFPTIEDAER